MDLLDLPLELFRKITHDLVEVAGIRHAWTLRATCRTFAAEIEHEIIMKRPIAKFEDWRNRSFLEKCADRYLEARLQLPLDVNKMLLEKAQKLVDWTIYAMNIKTQGERKSITQKICMAIADHVRSDVLVNSLCCSGEIGAWRRWDKRIKTRLDDNDKALGAFAAGSSSLLLKVLSRAKQRQGPAWFHFSPFVDALKAGDKSFLAKILLYLKSLPLDDPSSQMDRRRRVGVTDSDKMLSLNIDDAVRVAICYKNTKGFQSLLDFYENYLPRPKEATFDMWYQYAISQWGGNGEDQLRRLMDFKPGGKTMLTRKQRKVTCEKGTAAMIRDAFTRLGTDPDKGSILTLPIFVAVRSGDRNAVKNVIEAGADPNITALSNLRSLNKVRLTPIDVAIHKHRFSAIDALVTHGKVSLPHISEWPTHSPTYSHLRNIVIKETGAKLPERRDLKHLSNDQLKAIKY